MNLILRAISFSLLLGLIFGTIMHMVLVLGRKKPDCKKGSTADQISCGFNTVK